MRRLLVFRISFILLIACGNPEKQEQVSTEAAAKPEINIVAQSIKHHTFSDPATKDIFQIKLVGDTVQTAMVTFEITDSKGTLLYTDTFEANYLLNYDLPVNATTAQREAFIPKRIETFFDGKNFKSPAITADMIFEPNYSDEKLWNEIKADKNAISFHYLVGKEDGRWLAYSKAQNKVVLYFNCC